MENFFKNKIVLITGGAGTFGTKMTERLLKEHPDIKLIRIFSRNEKSHWEHKYRFNNDHRIQYIIGDVRDYQAVEEATIGVDYIFHAAAMKHIDKCAENPLECIKTNVYGSTNITTAAIRNRVTKVVLLSTDKATKASTTYGSSKFLMERLAFEINNRDTEFVITRYGNVVGSNGSVLPRFLDLASKGKPLPITDPHMTRFFMTQDEAVSLVMYAAMYGLHGELIVYNNKATTLKELADMISTNQTVVGLRTIEKTDEELLTYQELNHSVLTEDRKYYIVSPNVNNPINHTEGITSDNCERLTPEEIQELIRSVKNELK